MRAGFRQVLCAVGVIALVIGCGRTRATAGDVAPVEGEISIVVRNNHWNDVTLYLVHDGVSERVGTVTAATTRSFVLPLVRFGSAGTFRLSARQIGGDRRHTTESLVVQRGEHITYTLESDLDLSTVTVQ